MILNEQVTTIRRESPAYPQSLLASLGSAAPAELWVAGPLKPLDQLKTGFFCSSQCPGSIILKTFDAITQMRDEGQILIGGFHSVMEWECLGILLRGRHPVIWVPARSIVGMHLKPELVPAFNAGRLLILSPFPPKDKRITATLAEARNRFVGALADRIFVPHAAPNSRTLAICDQLKSSGKQIVNADDVLKEKF
jgi:predicted Rossmann fold nucleotide-binding protein DprA/Smf involved in DNA uptake